MRTEISKSLPQEAIDIRQKVFVEEQGFQNEFDEIDKRATHFVVFDRTNTPLATCRLFMEEESGAYILGRVAVVKEGRGNGIGSFIVRTVEEYVKAIDGKELRLHAQCRITPFYTKLGFSEYGQIEDDEGCPHIWMRKNV